LRSRDGCPERSERDRDGRNEHTYLIKLAIGKGGAAIVATQVNSAQQLVAKAQPGGNLSPDPLRSHDEECGQVPPACSGCIPYIASRRLAWWQQFRVPLESFIGSVRRIGDSE
jgi:hypothetical protein